MEQQKVRRSSRIFIKAVKKQDCEAVKNLLERGSNVNEVDYDGNSPLHYAALVDNFKIIELLLRHNAQVDIENNHGHSPYYYAIDSRDVNIINAFLQHKAEVRLDNIFTVALLKELYPQNVRKLLYENVNVKHVNSFGYTALHLAVENDDLYGIRTLISRGADVNKVTELGRYTPLHLARSTECIKILLRAGAEHNVQDAYSYSPLCTIVKNSTTKHSWPFSIDRKERQRMIEELVRNGANCIEVMNHSSIKIYYEASSELRYCLEDVLRFMVLKEHEHHQVNIDDLMLNHLQFYRQCLNEVVLLKEEKLSDYLTYYDFAAKSIHELSKYVADKSIKKALKNKSKLTYMFPIYSEILWSHFEEATEERKVCEAAYSSLSYAIPGINAGHIVTHKIVNFIEINDMKNIAQAFPSVKLHNNK